WHEADASGEVGTQNACHLQSQARFAHAPGAGDGEQAHLWMPEQLTDRPHLLFAADQGCEGQRETGKPWLRESRFVWRLCSCGSTPMSTQHGGSLSGLSGSSSQV